jgi:hypothetical protein
METKKKKYLVALPCFKGSKGFNHRTVLVKAKNKNDAISIVRSLKPHDNIGEIEEVDY